jgi:hypothetical protein
VADETMETEEVWIGFTVKLMLVEVDGLPVKQVGNVPPEVKTAITTSPFVGI